MEYVTIIIIIFYFFIFNINIVGIFIIIVIYSPFIWLLLSLVASSLVTMTTRLGFKYLYRTLLSSNGSPTLCTCSGDVG